MLKSLRAAVFRPPMVSVRHESLRSKYLRKSNIIMIDKDNNYIVEGVSDKQTPNLLPWRKPQPVQRSTPGEDGSGDLSGLPPVDLRLPPLELSGCELWSSQSPETRKCLSLEFQRHSKAVEVIKDKVVRQVQEHILDTKSMPVVIASMTVTIRNLQRDLKERLPFKNNAAKHKLKILIDHRRHILGQLREQDYRKFEWLIEKLDLVYKPRPFHYEPYKRFVMQERLVDLWCDEHRHFKLHRYKEKLEKQQPVFLKEKATKLRRLMELETELGLEASVTEDDIKACLEEAKRIEEKNECRQPEHYHVFEKKSLL